MGRKSRKRVGGAHWGFIGLDGRIAIPLEYEKTEPFFNGLATVTMGGLQGYMDRNGRWVVPPTFQGLGDFEEGLAYAIRDGKWGVIDRAATFVIPPTFDYLAPFRQGMARVRVNEKYGFIDRAGRMVISPRFQTARDFREGLALISDPNDIHLSWFIDFHGKMVLGPFRAAEHFSEGWAGVWDGAHWFFVDPKGEPMLRLPHGILARLYSEGLAAAEDQTPQSKDRWLMGYIDRQGRWALPPQYDFAGAFTNGFAPVSIGDRSGLIDKNGRYVVPLDRYENLGAFSECRIDFKRNGRAGYFDERGRVVIEATFSLAQRFSEGLAPVCIEQ